MKRTWLIVALANFLIATLIGAILRYIFIQEIHGLSFKNFMHAHSHIAMLGWIYMALYTLLIQAFLPKVQQQSHAYNRLFWASQIAVIGMLLSFPFQGYGPISITFSTAHIILSYIFVAWFRLDLGKSKAFSEQMVYTALIFMILSTLGVWVMGPIMAAKLRGSVFYYMAVQFYLHFQFNGWFIFALLALFFKHLERHHLALSQTRQSLFYILLVISCVMTYALAVAWAKPYLSVFAINSIGVLIQLSALIVFIRLIWHQRQAILASFNKLERLLLQISFFSFAFKIGVQTLVALPFIAKAAYTIRNYVIGFIHLVLLGAISMFLLSYAFQSKLLTTNRFYRGIGIWSIIIGFVLSETLLFLQGTMFWGARGFLPYYYELLFIVSTLIPLGIVFIFLGALLESKSANLQPTFEW